MLSFQQIINKMLMGHFTCNKVFKRKKHALFQFFFFFFFFCSLGPNLWHTEVPRLGVKSELQLPAYATAIITLDPAPQLMAMLDP